jgi:hypothetical protein
MQTRGSFQEGATRVQMNERAVETTEHVPQPLQAARKRHCFNDAFWLAEVGNRIFSVAGFDVCSPVQKTLLNCFTQDASKELRATAGYQVK